MPQATRRLPRFCALLSGALVASSASLVLAAASPASAAPTVYYVYADSTSTYVPLDPATRATVLGSRVDDSVATVSAPFPVSAYGQSYAELSIGSNGYVGFGPGTVNSYTQDSAAGLETPFVAAFWRDLVTPADGGVYTATLGQAPHRRFVVEWQVNRYPDYESAVSTSFQVVLAEDTADVVVDYGPNAIECGFVGIQRDPSATTRRGASDCEALPAAGTRVTYSLRPQPSLDTPASATSDATPTLSGVAATTDDAGDVTVRVHPGGDTSTAALVTLTATPDPATGAFSVDVPAASSLPDGTYTAQAEQTNVNGVGLGTARTFTVDTAVPTPVLSAPAPQTNDTTPTFSGTAGTAAGDDSSITVTVSRAGTPVYTTTQPTAPDGTFSTTVPDADALSPDGDYTVAVTQTDAALNVGTASATFTVDTAAPDAPVPATLTGPVSDATTALSGTAEPGSTVTLVLDGDVAGATTVVATAAGVYSFAPRLADGAHTFELTATDAAGNTGAPATGSFTLDSTAPDAPLLAAVTSPTSDATPTVSGTAEPDATVRLVFDGDTAGATSVVAGTDGTFSLTPATALGDGAHPYAVTATDAAGNTSRAATGSVTVDTGAPAAPVLATVASPAANRTPTVSGTAEPGSTVRLVLDGDTAGALSVVAGPAGGFSFTPASPLADGIHTVSVTATDAVGNTGPAATASFRVDTVAPVAPVLVALTSPTTNRTPTLSGTAEPGTTVRLVLDGNAAGALSVVAGPVGGFSFTPASPLADGTHTFVVTATDAAGNTSPAATVSVVVQSPVTVTAPIPGVGLVGSTPGAKLLLAKHSIRLALTCGPIACEAAPTAIVRLNGIRIATITAPAVSIPQAESRIVTLSTTRSLRERVRRSLERNDRSVALLKISVSFTASGSVPAKKVLKWEVRP